MLITVHGEHTLELAPERGTLRLGAQHEGSSADEVMEALQRTLGELVAALDELAARAPSPVVRRTVGTPRTHHWTDHLPDGVRAVRHVAAATVTVELDDPRTLADQARRWGERTDVQVEGVEWSLTEQTRAARTEEVLTAAVADATARAAVYARAAGRGEPQLVELADPGLLGGVGGDAGGMAGSGGGVRALAASAETVDPEPAPLRIRARVHARFEA